MDFTEKWREQISGSLVEAAGLAARVQEVDLEYSLIAVGVLWPLRQPVDDFDIQAIEAVQKILGRQARHVLKATQRLNGDLNGDLVKAARDLNIQLAENPELELSLNILIKHFQAFFIFTDKLSTYKLQQRSSTLFDRSETGATDEIFFERAAPQTPTANLAEAAQSPRVFVSYARKDGEALAQSLRERLEREGISVWQDRVMMEGGRDWWLQITEALNQVEFMILVMTPGAVQSEIVRKEWRYARQQGVCVYPIQAVSDLNFSELPRWMRNVHFYNPDLEWPKLIRALNEPCETPRVPFMVEDTSDDFVVRSDLLSRLTSLLLDQNGDPVPSTVGLYGTGGYGKTLLAKALCHHEDIRQAFDDGVLWITLGENPGDLTGYVVDLVEVLSGERPGFAGLDAAESRLVQLLADRDILLIIDDVWNIAHLKPFLRGGARCARLITTRNFTALPANAHALEVEAIERQEAINLLKMGLPDAPVGPLQELADRLGEWPLLLKLANGTLRDRVYNDRQALSDALGYVNKALDKRGLTAFDARNASARNQAVSQTLGISQELLTTEERHRYGEMAIFPGNVNIPLTVLEKLWSATAGLNDFDTEELCERLCQLSLLSHFDPNNRYVTLHNIVRRYLAQEQSDRLATLHGKFLDAYAAHFKLPVNESGIPKWSNLPQPELYLWNHLAYHLVGAGRGTQLVSTVKDLLFLVTKTQLRTAYAAEGDLLAARQVDPSDPVLTRLHQTFSQSSHLLNHCETLAEAANTLHSRLSHISGLQQLIAAGEKDLSRPLLTAYHRLPDLPDPGLIRTLAGHRAAVAACAVSANGTTLVSLSRDTILKIWDTNTGAERFTLSGHAVAGNSCAISDDGALIASASWDGILKLWAADVGSERISIKAHDDSIYGCALSADGAVAITASKDKTVKIWDTYTGTERYTLAGHERAVTGCGITADGTTVVSTSPDGTVKVWDARNGALRLSLKAYEATETHSPAAILTFAAATSALLSCAISRDGSTIVAALPDGRLKIWDARTGEERFTLEAHSGWIESCAISADGQLVVSASNDKTIKGWDTRTGAAYFSFEGHMRSVTGCAVNAAGTMIISASQDKTLKLWDVELGAEQAALLSSIYSSPTQHCAVSNDGRLVVLDSTDNTLRLLDHQTGKELTLLKGHMRPITGCAISLDGTVVVSSSQDRTLKIWDVQRGAERLTLTGHMWAVNDCALSSDGSMIVSASEDSTLRIWDAVTGTEQLILTGHMRGVNSCAISPDNSFIASASADKSVKIWEINTGATRFTLTGHSGPVNDCTISPDGQYVASTSNDNTVKLWDSQTGRELFTFEGHASSVLKSAFNPSGKTVLSVSKDKTLKLWDINSGQCLTSLRVDGSLSSCAWFPDGQHIVAVGSRGVYFLSVNDD